MMESAINCLVSLGVAVLGVIVLIVAACIILLAGYICIKITVLIMESIGKHFEKQKQAKDM
jgi:hypothetical protein